MINDKNTKTAVINAFNNLKSNFKNTCDDMLFYKVYGEITKCSHEENYTPTLLFNDKILMDYEFKSCDCLNIQCNCKP
jgi:hypothetical protein